MKIAIQGHPTRGHEVIQILESLGGINKWNQTGLCASRTYYIDAIGNIDSLVTHLHCRDGKIYTLEEFEKEFPFKVGDVVFHKGHKATVEMFVPREKCYSIRYSNPPIDGIYYTKWTTANELKMKEERNITLTLDKAKEWYKKGGELKEVALQAFTEKELTKVDLPKTWKEFCTNYPIQVGEAIVYEQTSQICIYKGIVARNLIHDKNIYPSEKSAEAHLAMIQLEQLRNCWRQGWIPETHEGIYAIKFSIHGLGVYNFVSREFLSFPTKEMAEEFLKCFRSLIEQAGDLI